MEEQQTQEQPEQRAEQSAPAAGDPVAIRRSVEALIFVSPGGVAVKKLAEVTGTAPGLVHRAVEELRQQYRERQSGLDILPVAGGYQLVTVPDTAALIEKLLRVVRKKHLSQPAMETLAIIAYRQPITKPEVEAIRGVDSSGVINGLLEKKFIRLAGRKKAPGKPLLYATTREFLIHFGLNDLRELPALSELGRPPGQEEVEVEELSEGGADHEPEAPPAG